MLPPVYHIAPEGKEKEGVSSFLFLEHLLHAGLYSEPLDLSMRETKIFALLYFDLGFPVAQMVKNLPAVQETQVQSLVWEHPLEKEMATHSSLLD